MLPFTFKLLPPTSFNTDAPEKNEDKIKVLWRYLSTNVALTFSNGNPGCKVLISFYANWKVNVLTRGLVSAGSRGPGVVDCFSWQKDMLLTYDPIGLSGPPSPICTPTSFSPLLTCPVHLTWVSVLVSISWCLPLSSDHCYLPVWPWTRLLDSLCLSFLTSVSPIQMPIKSPTWTLWIHC